MTMLEDSLSYIYTRIEAACERANRNPDEITIIAATKYVDTEGVKAVFQAGLTHIGENRVQDAQAKKKAAEAAGTWHMIGHLQTNKVKKALEIFDSIDSVDSFKLAEKINQKASCLGRNIEILIEVNTSGEAAKYGVAPDNLSSLITEIEKLENLKVTGLMAMAPLADDPEKARPYFKVLKSLQGDLPRLSMGMSDDFEVAIEEGATEIRLGRVLFE